MVIVKDYSGNHSDGLTRYLINTKGDKATVFFGVSYSTLDYSSGRHELAPFGIYVNDAHSYHSNCVENDWLRVDFEYPVSISSYSLKSYSTAYFVNWKLQATEFNKPGLNWYNIDDKNNDRSLAGGNLVNFVPSNISNTKTKRIRIMMQGRRAGNNDFCFEIFHFELFGKMYKELEFNKACTKRKGNNHFFMINVISVMLIV